MDKKEIEQFRIFLDGHGEKQIRQDIALGRFDERRKGLAENWLKEEVKRELDYKQQQLKLIQESNDIAKEAKNTSKFANKIAIGAIIFSLLALVVSILKP